MNNRGLLWFGAIGLLCVAGVLGYYAYHFWGALVSSSPEAWAAFGNYVGGALGPSLSFLALLVIRLTIRQQASALQVAKDTATQQSEYLLRKEKKEEWQRIIEHAEKQIHEQLKRSVHNRVGVKIGTLEQALVWGAEEVKKANRVNEKPYADQILKQQFSDVEINNFNPLATLLEALFGYLSRFKEHLIEQDPDLLGHYSSSY